MRNNQIRIGDVLLDETDVSIYHLIFLGNIIETNIKALADIRGKHDDYIELPITVSICSMTIIQAVSFLDEYNNFTKSSNESLNKTIIEIKKTVKPALKKINEWSEIRKFRNNVLAHNLRYTDKSISVFSKGLSSYDVPQNGSDFEVFRHCILMIKDVFASTFKENLEKVQLAIDNAQYNKVKSRYSNFQEVEEAVEKIRREINHNILNLKERYK